MLWGFPKYKPGANWETNLRTLKISHWRAWLDREHRCIVLAMSFAEICGFSSAPDTKA
jgi:putative SOS response-associated peptidase YedK